MSESRQQDTHRTIERVARESYGNLGIDPMSVRNAVYTKKTGTKNA